MTRSSALIESLLVIGAAAAGAAAQNAALPHDRRDRMAELSQRLAAGDAAAIDELLACTQPVAPESAPSNAEIERVRLEVERLRAGQSLPPAATSTSETLPATARDVATFVREARAWMRAGDPIRCLKTLDPAAGASAVDAADPDAAYWRACALERLGRDEEALEQYRRAAAGSTSPLMKLAAASAIEHVEWRLRRDGTPEAKP